VTTHSSRPVIPFLGIGPSSRLAVDGQRLLDRLGSKLAMLLCLGVRGNTLHAGDKPGLSSRKLSSRKVWP
jgi:hypothetical protein